jgi:hypothetical protein
MELWGKVFDAWSSYSLDQLDYMSLPQGHPLFIRRANLRQQKRHNEDAETTQPGEMDQLLHDSPEDEWSSYSLDQLDYMSLPQGHPLSIRRANLRQQKQHNEDAEKTQPDEMDHLLHDSPEEATLREIRAQPQGRRRQQGQRRVPNNEESDESEEMAKERGERQAQRQKKEEPKQDDLIEREEPGTETPRG